MVPLFGNIKVNNRKLVHWYLLYAIAINGHGTIPTQLIQVPWSSTKNRAEKYIESSVAAAWAVSQLKQNDSKTVEVLQLMKNDGSFPRWARHHFRTGQPHDFEDSVNAWTAQRK